MSTLSDAADRLKEKNGGHWAEYYGNNNEHPIEDWQYEVANNDTRLGYWEWVAARLDETGELS